MRKILLVLTCFLFFSSCKKDNAYLPINKAEIADDFQSKELIAFVTKTMKVDSNRVKFNSTRDSLILYDKVSLSVEETRSIYEKANEYRLKEGVR